MTRGQKIVQLAAEEAVCLLKQHLFRMDGLGLYSAMAERVAAATERDAREMKMSEEEHYSQIARLLIWDT